MPNKITVVGGAGYIGLPFSLILANADFFVECYDIDKCKIESLKNKTFFFDEKEIKKLYLNSSKKITFTYQLSKSDFFFICLPTPVKKDLSCDLSYIFKALKKISIVLQANNIIILESTVPVGTTNKVKNYLNRLRPDISGKFFVGYVPEKAIPGNTVFEMRNNHRVIGCDYKCFSKIKNIYKKFCIGKISHSSIESAEASKLVENAYRDNSIAFSNYISWSLRKKGLNDKEILEICNQHPRVKILSPSIGVGGHCIPIDPYFLPYSKNKGSLIKFVRKINEKKTKMIIKKLEFFFKKHNLKRKICLWGLGYKPGVSDIRESPAIEIVKTLKKKYKFFICDPLIKEIFFKDQINVQQANRFSDYHIILNMLKKDVKRYVKSKKIFFAESL